MMYVNPCFPSLTGPLAEAPFSGPFYLECLMLFSASEHCNRKPFCSIDAVTNSQRPRSALLNNVSFHLGNIPPSSPVLHRSW